MKLKLRLWFGGALSLLLVIGLARCGGDAPSPTEVDESGQLGLAVTTAGSPRGKTTSAAAPIRTTGIGPGPAVAVLAYCTDLSGSFGANTAESVLITDGRFGSVTLIDGDVLQPTGAELAASYQCALAMTDNRCDGQAPGSDQLDDFVGLGGGLVLSAFGFSTTIGFHPEILALSPLAAVVSDNGPPNRPVNVAGASTAPPCDALMAGVTPFSVSLSNATGTAALAIICAEFDDTSAFLAVKGFGDPGDAPVIGINLFPAFAADAAQPGWGQVLANSVAYACGVAEVPDVPGETCQGQAVSPGVTSFTFNGLTTFIGTDGSDVISGTDHADMVVAKGGDDLICTFFGPDVVDGGSDDDIVFGGTQNDRIFGKQGFDELHGEEGQDRLDGGHTPVPSSLPDTQPDICDGGPDADRFFLCETIIDPADLPK
jgi:hypothetical protein